MTPKRMTQEKDIRGIVIGGTASDILIRERSSAKFTIGELVVVENEHTQGEHEHSKTLLQLYDLEFASQLSDAHLQLMGGLALEEQQDTTNTLFFDENLRNYTIAHAKPLFSIISSSSNTEHIVKTRGMPRFFSTVRALRPDDFSFLAKPEHPLFLGKLRDGARTLDVPLYIDGKSALAHHILIAATTGRGKSNLLKCLLWELARERYCGMLVLDPHDEYYRGVLSRHPNKERIHQYSLSPEPGNASLRFNIRLLRPQHFYGVIDWSDAQRQALAHYYRAFGEGWIEAILLEQKLKVEFNEGTLAVLRRRLMQLLSVEVSAQGGHETPSIESDGVFVMQGAMTTIHDISEHLLAGEMVIIDTSSFDGAAELLIGSIIAHDVLQRHKRTKLKGELASMPSVSIVLEEAPRVLGKEVLEQGPNVFSTIAREGRKFKLGLVAITQLPSAIPREILANMNTKILLGLEMKAERQAVIESAAQDLSTDDRAIASLERGEAIVTSTFVPFALPIAMPLFEEFSSVKNQRKQQVLFSGVKLS